MHPTQTAIATALALAAVVFFFFFNGLSFFQVPASSPASAESAVLDLQASSSAPAMENVTELQVRDEVVGTGVAAAKGDTVTVNYVGSLTNGAVFDASANHGPGGFTFVLGAGEVIQGWDQGLVGMRVGGKRLLVIPASLAYGDRAIGNVIPANSTLVFAVELVDVKKP